MRELNVCTIFVLIIIALFNHSCTVKKRVYEKGYHVEWHNNSKIKNNNPEEITECKKQKNEIHYIAAGESNEEIVLSSHQNKESNTLITNSQLNNNKRSNSFEKTTELMPVKTEIIDNANKVPDVNEKSTNNSEQKDRRGFHWAASVSFFLGILGLLTPFAAIAAIVTGIIALKNIKKYPKIFKGKTLAIIAICLGVTGILMLVFLYAFYGIGLNFPVNFL